MKRVSLPIIVLFAMALFSVRVAPAQAADIYLVYTSDGKLIKKELQESLSDDLDIKVYNASLLVIADYTGKQKATSKLKRARIVVFLDDVAQELFGEEAFDNAILITESNQENISKILENMSNVSSE